VATLIWRNGSGSTHSGGLGHVSSWVLSFCQKKSWVLSNSSKMIIIILSKWTWP